MIVEYVRQRAGTCRFQLDAPPQSVLYELAESMGWDEDPDLWNPRNGYIVVTDSQVPRENMSLDLAIWTGVLTGRTGPQTFQARHISFLLGSGGAPAEYGVVPTGQAAVNLADAFAFQLAFQPFTVGTITEPGGTIDYNMPAATSRAEMLDYICDLFGGCGYRVNPDLSVDAGPVGSVFPSTPRVLIGSAPISDAATIGGPRGIRGTVVPITDVEQVSHTAIALGAYQGPDYRNVTVTSARQTTGDPITGAEVPTRVIVDVPLAQTDLELIEPATAKLAVHERPRYDYDVRVPASANVHDHVQPGQEVWVYDPANLALDATNPQTVRAVDVFPLNARTDALTAPMPEDAGVYLMRHDGTGQSWLPIHDWVRPSRSDAKLTVSTSTGILDPAAGEPARFYPNIARRILGNPIPIDFDVVTVAQGITQPTFTQNTASYVVRLGIVEFGIKLTMTGAGQSNNEIHVEFPDIPGDPSDPDVPVGQFEYVRASNGNRHSGLVARVSGNIYRMMETGNNNGVGQTPNFAIGVGDTIVMAGTKVIS